MPPFDYSGFTNIGRGVANTITEKRKRDKEKEDRERTARMLAQYGFPIQTVSDVAAGADPGLAIGLAEDQEKKFVLQDKMKAAQDEQKRASDEFANVLSQARGAGPMSPAEQAQQGIYAASEPGGQKDILNTLMEQHQKAKKAQLTEPYRRDPNKKMTADDVMAIYGDDPRNLLYKDMTWQQIADMEKKKANKEDKPDAYTQRLTLKMAEALARQSVDTQERIEARWRQAVASAKNVAPPNNVPLSIWGSQLPENDPTKTAYYNLRSADIQAALADAYRGLLDPDAMDIEVENDRKAIDALKKRVTALDTFLGD